MLGATIGAIFAGGITDGIGRKKAIMFSDVLTIIGPFIQFMASTVMMVCIGRVILGLGMGISMMAS